MGIFNRRPNDRPIVISAQGRGSVAAAGDIVGNVFTGRSAMRLWHVHRRDNVVPGECTFVVVRAASADQAIEVAVAGNKIPAGFDPLGHNLVAAEIPNDGPEEIVLAAVKG